MGLQIERPGNLRAPIRELAALALALAMLLAAGANGMAQDGAPPAKDKIEPAKDKVEPPKPPAVKLGLHVNDPKAFQGYTLFATQMSKITHLIDMQGRVVKTWETNCNPALTAYLLENGHLLRPGSLNGEEMSFGGGPGAGGRVQEFTWEGELVWDFKLFNNKQLPHHDITRLPNGNVLMIVWDKKTTEEAIAAGRKHGGDNGEKERCPDRIRVLAVGPGRWPRRLELGDQPGKPLAVGRP